MTKNTAYFSLIKNIEIFSLIMLIIITVSSTSYFNYQKKNNNQNLHDFINNIYLKKTLNNIFSNFEPRNKKISHKIKSGETIDKILQTYSIDINQINEIKKNISNKFNLNKLNTKQIIEFRLDGINKKILDLTFQTSNTEKIYLKRDQTTDRFIQEIIIIKLNKKILYKEDKINESFYQAAQNQNIPGQVIDEFARIYGFQIDFQRDIKKDNDNSFQVIYEIFLDENNKILETGKILYANLLLDQEDNSLYYFDQLGSEGHYDKNGKSVKKALMKTPINGARLSSGYGMRKHPISGFRKKHEGTDFAAPKGTPVVASGDGIVVKAGWAGGYGNTIRIKHNSTYETLYAHLSKFAKNIKKGTRVKQGSIIGYVGSTGNSTGPHLHYEVIVNGKKVNSQTLNLPSGKVLTNKEREIFEATKIKINVLKSEKIINFN